MQFSFEYLGKCLVSGIRYIPVTMELSVLTILLGLLLGAFIASARIYRLRFIHKFFEIFVSIYAGIPVMVSLLIYNLLYLVLCKPIANGALIVTYATFTLSHSVTYSETIRGAFLSVPKTQYEASYACGLSRIQSFRRIILPQLVPIALPTLTNNIIGSIKNTSIVMSVGIVDVLNGATIPCGETYSYVEGYVAAAIIYWAISVVVEFFLHRLERHFARKK